MQFADSLLNTTTTQNGALSNVSSLSACLDLFSMGVSSSFVDKIKLIKAALLEDPKTAIKVIFYLRDCRGGQGNKDILQALFEVKTLSQLIPFIAEYGSYKDLIKLYAKENDHLQVAVANYYADALLSSNNLAAKYAPRKGKLAKHLTKILNLTPKAYRQLIVSLSKTVEQSMCARKWSAINYKQVPSRANKLYAKAFNRHDSSRYQDFISLITSGRETMNSAQLYPHEIFNIVSKNMDYYGNVSDQQECNTAQALWKSLPNYMEKAVNVLPVIDVSGSMSNTAYSSYSCLDIAIGLGMYFAEHNTGPYKDLWMQFSSKPIAERLTGATLVERYKNMNKNIWQGSTNLQMLFDFVLRSSTKENTPKIILIISDMEFNSSCNTHTNFEEIRRKYAEADIELPVLVFWRVDIKSKQQPVIKSDINTVLVNGYSPAFCKTLLEADLNNITPLAMMQKAITKYSFINDLSF